MSHWKLTLAYDGTCFHGWQVQPGLPTIQGTLAATIRHVTGEQVLPQGSGRTDTGVHALGQVASFGLEAPIPTANLLRALNRALPPSIRVLQAEQVPPEFHARHSALSKTYEYRIFPRVPASRSQPDLICPPFLAPFAWDCPWHFDLGLAREAAAHILGDHDFTSFAAVDPEVRAGERDEPRSAIRRIFASDWFEESGLLVYRVTGSGFLHHMVRNLVGTFVDAAAGRTDAAGIPEVLARRHRSAAGQTAPARGLFLVSVEYPGRDTSLDSEQLESEASTALGAPCLASETWESNLVIQGGQ
jgi:tRNA pseudouridine38-40 synthase